MTCFMKCSKKSTKFPKIAYLSVFTKTICHLSSLSGTKKIHQKRNYKHCVNKFISNSDISTFLGPHTETIDL